MEKNSFLLGIIVSLAAFVQHGHGIACDTLFQDCQNGTISGAEACYNVTQELQVCENALTYCTENCSNALVGYIESTWPYTGNYYNYSGYCSGCDGAGSTCLTIDFLDTICFDQWNQSFGCDDHDSTIYVTSDGEDSSNCGSKTCPCGTIYYAVTYITAKDRYREYDEVTIDIRGVNFDNIISAEYCQFGQLPLSLSVSNLIINFNREYIRSTSDWFNVEDCIAPFSDNDIRGVWITSSDYTGILYSETWDDEAIDYSVEIRNWIFENVDFYSVLNDAASSNGDHGWVHWIQVNTVGSKGLVIRNATFNNLTYDGADDDDNGQGLIQSNRLKVYDSIFLNIYMANEDEIKSGFFGVKYQTSTSSSSDTWYFENVIMDSMYLYASPVIYLSADSLSSTNKVTFKNVEFRNIECDKGSNNFVEMVGGYGGVLNGLQMDLTNVIVDNALSPMFMYLEGKNKVNIVNFTYSTPVFDSGADGGDHDDYSVIFYVDSVAEVTVTNMDVTYTVMDDIWEFLNFNLSVLFYGEKNCDGTGIDILGYDDDADWNGFDVYLLRDIGYVPRIIWNLGEANFETTKILSDWNKTEIQMYIYDAIESDFDSCSNETFTTRINDLFNNGCEGSRLELINKTLTLLCNYYIEYTRSEFIEKLPLVYSGEIDGSFEYAAFYNDASGEMIVNTLYVGTGVIGGIFSNFGEFNVYNATTSLYWDIYDATNGNPFDASIDTSSYYDANDLYPIVIGFNTGDTYVYSSYFCGSQVFGYISTAGSLTVQDTLFSYIPIAMAADDDTQQLALSNSYFINVGRFYSSLTIWRNLGTTFPWAPFTLAAASSTFRNCTFEYYDMYGMMRFIPSDWSATGAISVTIEDCTFQYSSDGIIYPINTFDFLNVTDGSILTPGFITVKEGTLFTWINNIVHTEGSRESPWIYLDINQTQLGDDYSCWSGGELENFMLQVDSGVLKSCRVPNTPDFPEYNETRQTNLLNNGAEDDEIYCWQSLGSQTSYDETMTIWNTDGNFEMKSILINGEDSYVVVDRTNFEVSSSINNASRITGTWYPLDLTRGDLSLSDTEFIKDENLPNVEIDLKLTDSTSDANELLIWDILCLEVVQGDYRKIVQMQATCEKGITRSGLFDVDYNETFILSDIDSGSAALTVQSWSASKVNYTFGNRNDVYPGGWITDMTFKVLDKDNNQVSASDYTQDITIEWTNSDLNFDFSLTIESNNGSYICTQCESGFFIQGATIDDVYVSYEFEAEIDDDSSLSVDAFTLTFGKCPIGYGVTVTSQICEECEFDYLMMHRSTSSCFSCKDDIKKYSSQDAVECQGTDELIVSLDYWAYVETVYGENNDTDDVTYEVTYSDCPAGYCCRDTGGCNYKEELEKVGDDSGETSQLCAKNRDPNVPLCGACLEGYHEIYGTSACGTCDNPQTWILLLPVIVALVFVWYLVYFGKKPENLGAKSWHVKRFQIRGYRKQILKTAANIRRGTTNDADYVKQSLGFGNNLNGNTTSDGISSTADGPDASGATTSKNKVDDDDDGTMTAPGTAASAVAVAQPGTGNGVVTPADLNTELISNDALLHIGMNTPKLSNIKHPQQIQQLKTFSYPLKDHIWYELGMMQIMLFKNLAYYYQSLSYVLIQGGFTIYFNLLLNVFNLSFDSGSGNNSDSGICIFKDINGLREIWYQLFFPGVIYAFLLIFFIINKFTPFKLRCCKRLPHFSIAFWQITLLCLGVVLSVTLKLIACRDIGGNFGVRQFYAGEFECYTATNYISLIALIFIVVAFIWIYVYLSKLPNWRKFDPNFRFRTLMFSFKPERWYWEFVLLSRRILLAGFATFSYFDKNLFYLILLLIVAFYFGLQCYYRPYVYPECNWVEALLLFCAMAVVTGVGLIDTKSDSDNVLGIVVSVMIIVPFIVFLVFFIRIFVVYNRDIKPFQSGKLQFPGNSVNTNGANNANTNNTGASNSNHNNNNNNSSDDDDNDDDDDDALIATSNQNYNKKSSILINDEDAVLADENDSKMAYTMGGTAKGPQTNAVAITQMVNLASVSQDPDEGNLARPDDPYATSPGSVSPGE